VNNTGYAGQGIEIEDDILRLRQRKLEYEADAARRDRRAEPRLRWLRRLRLTGPRQLLSTDGRGIGNVGPDDNLSRPHVTLTDVPDPTPPVGQAWFGSARC
jgi:hypothetical protein